MKKILLILLLLVVLFVIVMPVYAKKGGGYPEWKWDKLLEIIHKDETLQRIWVRTGWIEPYFESVAVTESTRIFGLGNPGNIGFDDLENGQFIYYETYLDDDGVQIASKIWIMDKYSDHDK